MAAVVLLTGGTSLRWDAGREEALYTVWCARCHGRDARGEGPDASLFAEPPPPLVGNLILARHGDAEITAWVLDGKKLELGLRPEALREQSHRTEDLYRHLRRLPSVPRELVDEGLELYAARCLACHDDYGRPRTDVPPGAKAPTRDLSDPAWRRALDDEELSARVRHVAEGMPALPRSVSEGEAKRLVAFVELLSPGYELYDRFCLGCHGLYGQGDPDAPAGSGRPSFAFDRRYFERYTPEWVLDRAWHMLRDARAVMPHFAVDLTEEDVRQILRYLRTLEP